jgi:hypothetical protein
MFCLSKVIFVWCWLWCVLPRYAATSAATYEWCFPVLVCCLCCRHCVSLLTATLLVGSCHPDAASGFPLASPTLQHAVLPVHCYLCCRCPLFFLTLFTSLLMYAASLPTQLVLNAHVHPNIIQTSCRVAVLSLLQVLTLISTTSLQMCAVSPQMQHGQSTAPTAGQRHVTEPSWVAFARLLAVTGPQGRTSQQAAMT